MTTGWHRADIICAIHKKGTTLAALGRRHGYADSTLRAALMKPRKPANQVIASYLGVSLHELWPAWFDAEGRLLVHQTARGSRQASSQKRTAA